MTTLQTNGQITLPREARKEMGIRPGERLVWVRNQAGRWEIWSAEALNDHITSYDEEYQNWARQLRSSYKK